MEEGERGSVSLGIGVVYSKASIACYVSLGGLLAGLVRLSRLLCLCPATARDEGQVTLVEFNWD